MKKVALVLVVLLILNCVLAGCSNNSSNNINNTDNNTNINNSSKNNDSSSNNNQNNANNKEKIDPLAKTLTISYLRGVTVIPDKPEDDMIKEYLEEEFNVILEPTYLEGDWVNQKNILFASGDITDFFWDPDPEYLVKDMEQGFVNEVSYDLLNTYAPTLVAEVTKHAKEQWLWMYNDGKNYGIPNLAHMFAYPKSNIWRKDWLENLGYDAPPSTIEEMEEVLYKFAKEDPDNNGKDDTWGMTTGMIHWWMAFTDIFGAYGVLPFCWMEDNGKAAWGGTLDQTKEALIMLNDWYDKGIIHPDFVTDHAWEDTKDKMVNSQVGYVYGMGNQANLDLTNPNSWNSILGELTNGGEFVASRLPKGPNGDSGAFVWGKSGWILCAKTGIDEEKIIRMLMMFERQTSDFEFSLNSRFGKEGVTYDYADGKGVTYIDPYTDSNTRQKEGIGDYWKFNISNEFYEASLTPEEKEFRDQYSSTDDGLRDLFFKPGFLPSAGSYIEDLRQLQQIAFSEMIIGSKDPETYFDIFVSDWMENGGEQLTKEANEIYSNMDNVLASFK